MYFLFVPPAFVCSQPSSAHAYVCFNRRWRLVFLEILFYFFSPARKTVIAHADTRSEYTGLIDVAILFLFARVDYKERWLVANKHFTFSSRRTRKRERRSRLNKFLIELRVLGSLCDINWWKKKNECFIKSTGSFSFVPSFFSLFFAFNISTLNALHWVQFQRYQR